MSLLGTVQKTEALGYVILESFASGIVRLFLNKSQLRNALDAQLITDIRAALKLISSQSECRLLIFQGSGGVFCAGADLKYMQIQSNQDFEQNLKDAHALGALFFELASCPVPVVAAVQGAAIGGGMGLVACADVCVSEASAVFATSEVKLGLVPGVIGPFLTRKMGLAWAQKCMYSGARFEAQNLVVSGLVTQVSPNKETFNAVLEAEVVKLLQSGPEAAKRCKQLLLDCVPLPSVELRAKAAEHIALARSTHEAREGLASFFEKRLPNWQLDLPKEHP